MTVRDLLTAKWKLTPNGWSKLGVEMRRHCFPSHTGEEMYIAYAMLSNDEDTGEIALAAVSESTPLSEIENIIRSPLTNILSSKYYRLTPKHKRTLHNWLYDNGRRITST